MEPRLKAYLAFFTFYGCNYFVVCRDDLDSVVVVTTAAMPNELNQSLDISLLRNDGSPFATSYKFIYRSNPTFRTIQPRSHLIAYVSSNSRITDLE